MDTCKCEQCGNTWFDEEKVSTKCPYCDAEYKPVNRHNKNQTKGHLEKFMSDES